VLGAHAYIGRLPRFVRYTYDAQVDQACECVDLYGGGGGAGAKDTNEGMTVRERLKHLSAPVGWRDEVMIGVMARFLGMYKDRQEVDYWEAIRDLGFMDVLEGVEGAMRGDGDVPIQGMETEGGNKKKKQPTKYKKAKTKPTNPVLSTLESFHKTAVMYIWLSYRMPVVYAQQEVVVGVKRRVEGALEWCLEGMTMGGKEVPGEKEKKVDITMRLRALVLERQENRTKDKVKGTDR
jgi:ATP-dependent RNA helicase SUPV3L1/SUV3